MGPFKKCVTWIMAFSPHSPLLSPFNFTLSLPLGYSLKIRHYGMRRNFFLHIWLFQHITLYQRRLNITSLVTINFLETHVCINNLHKKVVYYNIFVQILYSYFRYINRLFFGCVLFLARCNISRASLETKIELQNKVHSRICVMNITFLTSRTPFYVIFCCFLRLFPPLPNWRTCWLAHIKMHHIAIGAILCNDIKS